METTAASQAAPGAAPTAVDQPKKFEGKTLVPTGTFAHALEPSNFEQTMALANLLAKSDIIPKDFQGKPANILTAVSLGRELGVGWAQSLQNICVVNGRPSAWGDLVMGLVLNSTVYEDSWDEFDPKLDGGTAIFHSKRRGKRETVRTFSHEDAKKAELLGKDTYKKYERRMLFNRARAFALRDDYADVLKGLRIREEEEDIIIVTPVAGAPAEYAMPRRASEATAAAPNREEPPTPQPAAPQPAAEPKAEVDAGYLVNEVTPPSKKNKEWEVVINGEPYSATDGMAKAAAAFKEKGTRVLFDHSGGGVLTEIQPA